MKGNKYDKDLYQDLRILYVEDDVQIRSTFELILKKIFKELYCAQDGQEALELYNELKTNNKPIDAIISDINMPKMDGMEFLEEIRKDDFNIPFIFTTAYSETDYLLGSIKKNVTDYLLKPVDIGSLVEKIEEVCGLYRQKKLIQRQKKELERYLSAIDNVAIISKTDLKGKITFANDIFCKIAQYSREELYGQPHNIVRHQDVPSETYAKLWETIQSGHSWQGKVKNKAKDGSAYFVNATIIPLFEEQGIHVKEYIGIRFLTTSDEVEKREFKKKVMQNFNDMRKKHFEDADYIAKLEKRLKEFEHVELLESAMESERKKSSRLQFQVKFYEKELKDLQDKNSKLLSLSKEKINEISKKTRDIEAENNKLKSELGSLSSNNDKNSNKVVLLETKILELEDRLAMKKKSITNLKELLTFREEQIKNLKY